MPTPFTFFPIYFFISISKMSHYVSFSIVPFCLISSHFRLLPRSSFPCHTYDIIVIEKHKYELIS